MTRKRLTARNFKEVYAESELDFLTKTELAKLAGCDRRSLINYEKLAIRVDDYRKLMRRDKQGTPERGAPLAPYQAWVLVCIQELYLRNFRTSDIRQLLCDPKIKSKLSYQSFTGDLNDPI